MHQFTCFGIGGAIGRQLLMAVERRLGGDLGDIRGRDEEILRQALGHAHQLLGQHHPADAPAGHGEIFGEGVDDDGAVAKLRGAGGWLAIGQAMVNLVGNQADAVAMAIFRQSPQLAGGEHGARGVRGAGQDQPVRLGVERLQHGHRRLKPGLNPARQNHRLQPQRRRDIHIRRVIRGGQRHRSPGSNADKYASGNAPEAPNVTAIRSGDRHPVPIQDMRRDALASEIPPSPSV